MADFLTDAEMEALEAGERRTAADVAEISDEQMMELEARANAKPIGMGRAALRGAVQGVTDLAEGALGFGGTRALLDSIARYRGKQSARAVFETLMAPYMPPEPVTEDEITTERVVRSATTGIPMSLTGASAVPAALGAVGSITGPLASEVVRRGGGGRVAQTVAGAVGGMGPGIAGGAMGAAMRGRSVPLAGARSREAAELAAAADLRGAVGASAVERATQRLREEVRAGASIPGHARTAQVLMDDAPGVVGLEAAVARRFPDIQSRAAARLDENQAAVNLAEDMMAGAGPDALVSGWRDARDIARAGVREAYERVDPSSVATVSAGRIKDAAQQIVEEAGEELASKLPSEVNLIARYGDEIDFSSLQRLRTSLSDTVRGLSRDPGKATDLRFAQRLRASVDQTLDDLAQSGQGAAPALREAITRRAEFGRLFDQRHPAVRALEQNERATAVVDTIASGGTKRPVEEARRVIEAVGRDTQAHEGLKRMWLDRALGGQSLWDARSESSIQFLRKNAAASSVILGQEGHAAALRLIERVRNLRFGRVGTRGMALGTGSSIPESGELADSAGSALLALLRGRPGQAASVAAGKAYDWLVRSTTPQMRSEILADALMDPQQAMNLLESARPERLEAFLASARSHVARQAARQAATESE
jgi:hypothetical protein